MNDHDIIAEIEAKAVECGIPYDKVSAFMAWVGNEVAEGREVANLMVLRERTPELVKIYQAENATRESRKP